MGAKSWVIRAYPPVAGSDSQVPETRVRGQESGVRGQRSEVRGQMDDGLRQSL
jgi:hypothetical protein